MPSVVLSPGSTSRAHYLSSYNMPATQGAHDSTDGIPDLSEFEDCIDPATFEQILEMDDDESREFSRGLVFSYFDQAESTFGKIEQAIAVPDLPELSRLGHFLKGSSASLGLTKVKDACEKIQHYGARKDESGTLDEADDAKSLANIKSTLVEVKDAYDEVGTLLKRFYRETD